MFMREHVLPIPPHEHPLPIRPIDRHSMVSIIYDGNKLQETFGDLWSYHVDKIAMEPPEIKILFAIEMGFKVSTNQRMIEAMMRQRDEEAATGVTSHGFMNASLDKETLQKIGSVVSIDADSVDVILSHAPEGVVSTIIAASRKVQV